MSLFRPFNILSLGATFISASLLLLVALQLGFLLWSALTGAGIWGSSMRHAAAFADWPGLTKSTLLSLWTGTSSAIIALWVAKSMIGLQFAPGPLGRLAAALTSAVQPVLAVPHVAFAVGLTFMIWPGGWIGRLLSPTITGWERVPDWVIVGDPLGISLIIGLILREIPFLMFTILGAFSSLDVSGNMKAGKALGLGPLQTWERILWPQLWPKLRLPLVLVLAYGLSNVEMTQILGPNTPPLLSVTVLQLFTDADPEKFAQLPWAGLYLLLVTSAATAAVIALLGIWQNIQRSNAWSGPWPKIKRLLTLAWSYGAFGTCLCVAATLIGGTIASTLFAFSSRWYFPAPLPNFTLKSLNSLWDDLASASLHSLSIALCATLLALGVLVFLLERFATLGRKNIPQIWLIGFYVPLVIPQIFLVLTLYASLLALGISTGWIASIFGHALFCFCFSALMLGPTWLNFNPSLIHQAQTLGLGPWQRLMQIKIPMMRKQLSLTFALSMTVSFALYLPTLVFSGGRIDTLLTEGVHFASNFRRPQMAIFALAQTLLSLGIFFLIAFVGHNKKNPLS